MKTYLVTLERTVTIEQTVEVEADSPEQARAYVETGAGWDNARENVVRVFDSDVYVLPKEN